MGSVLHRGSASMVVGGLLTGVTIAVAVAAIQFPRVARVPSSAAVATASSSLVAPSPAAPSAGASSAGTPPIVDSMSTWLDAELEPTAPCWAISFIQSHC